MGTLGLAIVLAEASCCIAEADLQAQHRLDTRKASTFVSATRNHREGCHSAFQGIPMDMLFLGGVAGYCTAPLRQTLLRS